MSLRRMNSSLPQVVGFTRRSLKSLKFAGDSLDSSSSPALIHGIHVFHCPDTLGIVAKLSECIASRGGNILGADIFVPQKKQVFYSRSDFVFDPAKWPRVKMEEDFLKLSKMFNAMKSVVRVPTVDPKYKIAVLASKQDHCLVDLLHGWQDGRLPVDITCIISNHDRGPNTHVIRFLERHGIPYHYLHKSNGSKREAEILDLVQDTDFLVLARYMQEIPQEEVHQRNTEIPQEEVHQRNTEIPQEEVHQRNTVTNQEVDHSSASAYSCQSRHSQVLDQNPTFVKLADVS